MKKLSELWRKFVAALQKHKILGIALDNLFIKAIYALALILLIVFLLPSQRPFEYSNLVVGSISRNEIIAPFTFPILKTKEELEKERRQARKTVPDVFRLDKKVQKNQILKLKSFFRELERTFRSKKSVFQKIAASGSNVSHPAIDSLLQNINLRYNAQLTPANIIKLFALHKNKKLGKLETDLEHGLREVYAQGVLNRDVSQINGPKLIEIQNGIEQVVNVKNVWDVRQANTHVFNFLSNLYKDETDLEVATTVVSPFIIPDLMYDEQITEERKAKAVHDVPATRGFVYKNQRIIDSHEIVTPEIYQKLQSLADAQREHSAMRNGLEQYKFYLGKILFALSVVLIIALYLVFYRRKLFTSNKQLGMIVSILILQLLFTLLNNSVLHWNYWSIPLALAPILLTVLLDLGIAFICLVGLSATWGGIQGNDFTVVFMSLIVGTVAIYSVLKIRNRGQMFRAILYILLAYLGVNFTFGFLHFEPIQNILKIFAFYLLPNAILTPAAAFLLIGVYEKLFDVTTDITLLELSDLNHPLLKRLAVEAPGTFHHSNIVGNLAEAGAEAIGANALLARVGCYYHDIGKMEKKEYFVENQMDADNKHEKLSPNMSCLILINHVKRGIELAEKFNLPNAVKQFIPEHHGTSLISFFYKKALEQKDGAEVNESDFHYPGPKPQSKETGIAMLADTVEAACRLLQNPTRQRLQNRVNELVENKIKENQLDECDLTLKDLQKVKEAFVSVLTGIHHSRIEYPGDEEKPSAVRKGRRAEDRHINGKKLPDAQSSEIPTSENEN